MNCLFTIQHWIRLVGDTSLDYCHSYYFYLAIKHSNRKYYYYHRYH